MLETLKDLFESLLQPAAGDAQTDERALRLATAVVLVEVMRADETIDERQRDAVRKALRQEFALADDEAARLAELAETTSRHATDLYSFTSRIDERFDTAHKIRIVEEMWRVAYADGRLSDNERHVLWRIADLLHVPQGAYVNARLRARDAAGG
ncbi:MAG: TerB family tellurite resistance protein [Burkholderiaceae bacterium]|nr:TerB family tellurite resistance protein [Burkholderiaceae bacterium]